MDKNYNVDDILSEIKARKLRQKEASSKQVPGTGDMPVSAPPSSFEEKHDSPPLSAEHRTRQQDIRTETTSSAPATKDTLPLADVWGQHHANRGADPAPPEEQPFVFKPFGQDAPESPVFQVNIPNMQDTPIVPPHDVEQTRQIDSNLRFNGFAAEHAEDASHTNVLPPIYPPAAPPERKRSSRLAATYEAGSLYEEQDYFDADPNVSNIDFSEYNSLDERRDVATDIARVKLWLLIRGVVTFVLTGILIYIAFAGKYTMPLPKEMQPVTETMRGYVLSSVVFTSILALVNSSSIGGGLSSLVKMRANSDTLSTLAILAALAQCVMGVVRPDWINPLRINLYYPVAAVAVLFGVVGKLTMINRIQSNFRLLSSNQEKKALLRVEDERFCREFIPGIIRRPTIAHAVSADFFTDFLGLSYSDKYDVGINRAVAPVCLLGAIGVGVASFMLSDSMQVAVWGFVAVLCVTATLSATFIENIPLRKLTKKLVPMGGIVSGNKAVEDFCDTEAVILTETDLFPEGHVQLRGIQTFSEARIDQAILDAASVVCAVDGALNAVFLQMIGGNCSVLMPVENIVCEEGMGISAWVNARRVLIGNRTLMQAHGVTIPPDAAKQRPAQTPEDGEPIYLSSSGEIMACFFVSYHRDDSLAAQLDLLAVQDRQLIIHANDANITADRIAQVYGYPEELISIIPPVYHAQYRAMTQKRKSAIAEIVYTGKAPSMIAAIVACIHARNSILSATTMQLIQIIISYGLVAFMSFMGIIGELSIVQIGLYQLFWFLVIFIVQEMKQS